MMPNCSNQTDGTVHAFVRMEMPYLIVYYFALYLLVLASNSFAEYLWKEEKLIPKAKVTILNTFKMNYIVSVNRDVSLTIIALMIRALVGPINYYLVLLILLPITTERMKCAINLIYLFSFKLLLVKKPGFVEAYSAHQMCSRLKLMANIMAYGPTSCFMAKYLVAGDTYNRFLAHLAYNNCAQITFGIHNIPIYVLIVILVGVASAEVVVNRQIRAINLKLFTVVMVFYTLIAVIYFALANIDMGRPADHPPAGAILISLTHILMLFLIVWHSYRKTRNTVENSELENLHVD